MDHFRSLPPDYFYISLRPFSSSFHLFRSHVYIIYLLSRRLVWVEILTNVLSVASILDFPASPSEDSSGSRHGFVWFCFALLSISFTPSLPFSLWPCTKVFPHLWVKHCHCQLSHAVSRMHSGVFPGSLCSHWLPSTNSPRAQCPSHSCKAPPSHNHCRGTSFSPGTTG